MKTIILSQAWLDAAEGRSCVNCGAMDDTIVPAHYTGLHQQEWGKGHGIKVHDILAADLCRACHLKLDNYNSSTFSDLYMRKIDMSEQFLTCVIRTLLRRIEQGVVTIKGYTPSK